MSSRRSKSRWRRAGPDPQSNRASARVRARETQRFTGSEAHERGTTQTLERRQRAAAAIWWTAYRPEQAHAEPSSARYKRQLETETVLLARERREQTVARRAVLYEDRGHAAAGRVR